MSGTNERSSSALTLNPPRPSIQDKLQREKLQIPDMPKSFCQSTDNNIRDPKSKNNSRYKICSGKLRKTENQALAKTAVNYLQSIQDKHKIQQQLFARLDHAQSGVKQEIEDPPPKSLGRSYLRYLAGSESILIYLNCLLVSIQVAQQAHFEEKASRVQISLTLLLLVFFLHKL